jgi:hypothetical protein
VIGCGTHRIGGCDVKLQGASTAIESKRITKCHDGRRVDEENKSLYSILNKSVCARLDPRISRQENDTTISRDTRVLSERDIESDSMNLFMITRRICAIVAAACELTDVQLASFKAGNLYVNVRSAERRPGELSIQLEN